MSDTNDILASVRQKHDRLLRNKQAVAYLTAMLPTHESLLAEAKEQLAHYTESVARLTKLVEDSRKRLEFALNYCNEHKEDDERVKEAEKLAARIEKLQERLLERKQVMIKSLEGQG